MSAASATQVDRYLRPGFRFFTPTPTRWGDCDMFGHVNNVQFIRYYESGRLDYFHRLLDMAAGPDVHNSLIIADIHVTYLRQIHHPGALEVGSRISRLGNSSFDFEAAIFCPARLNPVRPRRRPASGLTIATITVPQFHLPNGKSSNNSRAFKHERMAISGS